jgi:hypothetical protein
MGGKKGLAWVFAVVLLAGISVQAKNKHEGECNTSATTIQSGQTQVSQMPRADIDVATPTDYRAGWDQGYKLGYDAGVADHQQGAKFDADDAPGYKGYRTSFESSLGKRSHFKSGWKKGFKNGYDDGYSGVVSQLITTTTIQQSSIQPQPQTDYESESSVQQSEQAPSQEARADENWQTQPSSSSSVSSTSSSASSMHRFHRTSGHKVVRRMPRTASDLPLIALIGLLAIASSQIFRVVRKRQVLE